jgi:hypothetical protein
MGSIGLSALEEDQPVASEFQNLEPMEEPR